MDLGEARQRAVDNGFKTAVSQARSPWKLGQGLPINQIVAGDAIDTLNALPENWVDLVFADPPFNIGYLYHGYKDKKSDSDYLAFSEEWMKAIYRALKPGGSFYLAIGDDFAADLCVIARRTIGFTMRNWIIWHYTFGQQTKKKFARSHTHIFYFTKGDEGITFNADDIRVPSARQTVYADSRANSKGKLPDDTWFTRPQAAQEAGYFAPDMDTWNVSRLCGTFNEREGWHGCQMPITILDRIIKASSNEGDIVLDPFNGSGTTCVSAALHGRRFVGLDQSKEYVAYARQRIEHALDIAAGKNGHVHDKKRASKVKTVTDAFGRPRVPRKRATIKA